MSSEPGGLRVEQLQTQLTILSASLKEKEDVLARLERVVEATTTGIVVLNQKGQVAVLLNADCAPLLELGQPLPLELEQALAALPVGDALECERFDIVKITRDENGKLIGFAFFPKEAVEMTPQETVKAESGNDMFADLLGGKQDDDELADVLNEIEHKDLPLPGKEQSDADQG